MSMLQASLTRIRALVGIRIRSMRELKGISANQLARAAGVGVGTISELERGRRTPNLDTMLAIAAALDVSSYSLIPTGVDAVAAEDGGREIPVDEVSVGGLSMRVARVVLRNGQTARLVAGADSRGTVLLVVGGSVTLRATGRQVLQSGMVHAMESGSECCAVATDGFGEMLLVNIANGR